MTVGDRIKQLRKQKDLTQSNLAKVVDLTYIQIGRYETGKSNPSADVLQRLAKALETTTDFLMNGSTDEVVSAQLSDMELLNQFKEVEKMTPEDKNLIKTFIDAFITKRKVQRLAQ